jgi:hypothetical protein
VLFIGKNGQRKPTEGTGASRKREGRQKPVSGGQKSDGGRRCYPRSSREAGRKKDLAKEED